MVRFQYCEQAEWWNCSLVATLSNWASSFNLRFCFLSFEVTSCSDHSLETFCLTPTCLKRKLFPLFHHIATLLKRSQKWQKLPKGRFFLAIMDEGSVWKVRMAEAELATSRRRSSPSPPLLFLAAAAAATKVVVCFVFVKLCILWRLYCCKKCWKKKKK